MEGDLKIDEASEIQSEIEMSQSSLSHNENKKKRNYDDEVLVSKPNLSSNSTLQPDTLELR